jgi:D-alanine-D-alanine ligase
MLPASVVVLVNADFISRAADCAGALASPAYEADAAVLDTAAAISRALVGLGIRTSELRVTDSLDGVLGELAARAPTVVFNLVESIDNDYGREWEVPHMLGAAGFAYTGNGPEALRICRCKDQARERLAKAGVRIAEATVVDGPHDAGKIAASAYPVFVKPARVDGSIGIDAASVCATPVELRRKLESLAGCLPGPFLVERYLPGTELNVSIIPEPGAGVVVATEIDFSAVPAHLPRFVTYESKWNPESPEYASISVAAKVPPALLREVHDQARQAFLALSGDGYGRVDLRLDSQGIPHVIDVNPNNDLHPEAGLARAAASAGLDYPGLLAKILAHAQEACGARGR